MEREIGVSKDFNGFELRDALVRKDALKANRIINYLTVIRSLEMSMDCCLLSSITSKT